jgi:hypothetical protein
MKSENDDLRAIYRAYAASHRPLSRKHCPSVRAIANSFDPGASRRKKKRIIDHLSECSYCREEFDLFFRLQMVPGDAQQESVGRRALGSPDDIPRTAGPNVFPLWRYAALVLGFGLIVSILLLFFQRWGLVEVQRTEGPGVVLVSPVTAQAVSKELLFRWKEFPSAQHYVLELFDEALLQVWVSPPLHDRHVQLPDNVGREIRPGSSYFWMVTAYSGQAKIGESRLGSFKILEK